MTNQSKQKDPRFWKKWRESGAVGNINGPVFGEAYAFFDCDASRQEIERYMPEIRYEARTPKSLRILLQEGISGLQLDETFAEQISYPADYRVMSSERLEQGYEEERRSLSDLQYVMVARYRVADNEDTAGELGDILNVIHRRFNRDKGLFRGAVAYEKDGEYILKEED